MTPYQKYIFIVSFYEQLLPVGRIQFSYFESWKMTDVLIVAPTGRSWYCSSPSALTLRL